MAIKYFAWKYPVRDTSNPDWVELSGYEFFKLVSSEMGKDRYFRRIDDGIEDGMDVIVLETTHEGYVRWHNQYENARQKKERLEKYKPLFVSMDSLVCEESEFTYHDVIPDESVDVEKTVVHKMLLERLRDILKELSAEEMDTLNLLFFFNEDDVSERGLTEGDDRERMKLRRKKEKIFKKIRSKF